MRSLSDRLIIKLPIVLALVLLGLFAAPAQLLGITFTPNIAWIMTLVVGLFYPPAWPRVFAFLLGLLQDIIFGTPLGSQGLLTLLLVYLVSLQARRQPLPPFHICWLEAAGVLIVWHGLLYALYQFVTPYSPSLQVMLVAGAVSALWYPLFYFPLARLMQLLPPLKKTH